MKGIESIIFVRNIGKGEGNQKLIKMEIYIDKI